MDLMPQPDSPHSDGSGAAAPGASSALSPLSPVSPSLSRYESQKRLDWNTFGQFVRNHRPPLSLARCSGAHVLEFLRYLDQFGKTKVHTVGCPFFGHPAPPAPCPCPLRQAWGSLDAIVGRLRAAYEENGGRPENNPFGARAVRLYLREVRETQARARGVSYDKKKRRKPSAHHPADVDHHHHVSRTPATSATSTSSTTADVGHDVEEEFTGCREDTGAVHALSSPEVGDQVLYL